MTLKALLSNKHLVGSILAMAVVIILTVMTRLATASPPKDDPDLNLFVDITPKVTVATPKDFKIIRARPVSINFELLGGTDQTNFTHQNQPVVGDKVQLNLFDNVAFTAILDRIFINRSGSYAWVGHLEEVEASQVIFIVKQGVLSGNISSPNFLYSIRYSGETVHIIEEIDPTKFPSHENDEVLPDKKEGNVEEEFDFRVSAKSVSKAANEDTSVIDIMVVFTSKAVEVAGGITAIENDIDMAMIKTNEAFTNSGIYAQVNIVHTAEINYIESGGLNTDLDCLVLPNDGCLDIVHLWRNTYTADVVTLIVESPGCGVAVGMQDILPAFEKDAFNVVKHECLKNFYTFAHELGHNMGGRHEWYDNQSIKPYPYAHGYVNLIEKWRTIMAIGKECSDNSIQCQQIGQFSNPDVSYNDSPTGIPEGQPYPADIRKVFNQTAPIVSNFRLSGNPPSENGPIMYVSYRVDDNIINYSNGNDNGIAECGENIEFYVYLRNQNILTAAITSTLDTADTHINWEDKDGTHPDIEPGRIDDNDKNFAFVIAPDTPNGHIAELELNIYSSVGGPWSESINLPIQCLNKKLYLPIINP